MLLVCFVLPFLQHNCHFQLHPDSIFTAVQQMLHEDLAPVPNTTLGTDAQIFHTFCA